jgi:hypothetical protein
MANETIKITMDNETGEIVIEPIGFKGKVCLSKIDFLVKALMDDSPKVTYKAEFYQENTNKATVKL